MISGYQMGLFGKSPADKKFNAALNVVMAEVTYPQLSDEQRRKVDEFSEQIVSKTGHDGYEAVALFAMPRELHFAIYSLAMKKLGIKPAVPREDWRKCGNPFASEVEEDEDALEQAYDYLKQEHSIDLYAFGEDE